MLDVILTLEEAANKLAPLCVQRSFLTLMDDALVDDELIFSDEQRESLAQEIAALFSAHDLEERLLIHLETGRINARSFLHDGRVFLNGKPAHKGVLVSLAEAEQALREHDHITFAEPPNTEEEPGGIADPMSEQVAATSAVSEKTKPPAKVQAVISSKKLRTNSLDVPIDKAIEQAGCLKTSAVFLKLKELALSGEAPFTGLIEGDALCYTNDNDETDLLTKNALDKRLAKRRKQT